MIGEVAWHESITCILDLPERFSIILMFAYARASIQPLRRHSREISAHATILPLQTQAENKQWEFSKCRHFALIVLLWK